jgi:probable O-glycosylation ligase (exosortase A-associated)
MLRTILICAILSFGLSAGIVNRFAALLLYVWFALFRPIEWVWIDLSQFRLSFITGALLVVPCLATGVFPNLTHPLSLGTIAFLAAAAIAHLGAVSPDISLLWLDYLARLIMICLFAVTLVSTPQRFKWMLITVAGSFGFHSAKGGLASILGGGVRFYDGLAGAFIDNNGYAVGSAMIVFLLLCTAQNVERRWLKAAWWTAVPLSAMTVVSTFSRGGLLALAAGTLAFVAVQRQRIRAAVFVAVALLVLYATVPLPAGYTDRIATIESYGEGGDVSAISRLHFWRVALNMAAHQPLGVGLFNFPSNYDRYDTSSGEYGSERAVHNSHLQVLTETGVIGAAAYVFLFAWSAVLVARVRTQSLDPRLAPSDSRLLLTAANALFASMAAFLVGGTFVSMALNDVTWITFALIAALDRVSQQLCADADVSVPGIADAQRTPALATDPRCSLTA